MINYLDGTVKDISENSATVLVGGVGYEVFVPNSFSQNLKKDSSAQFFIYTHVREDILALYGFATKKDLAFYRLLISVSGIGPKVALSIISSASVDKLIDSIGRGDPALLSAVSGVGKKTAEKAVVELKNKVGLGGTTGSLAGDSSDIIEALVGLGFQRSEAAQAISNLPEGANTQEEKIKAALKILGK